VAKTCGRPDVGRAPPRQSLTGSRWRRQRDQRQLGAGIWLSWPQPHLVRQFKLPKKRYPQFAAKLHEIVGLYVDPPDHAIVLSVDSRPNSGPRSHPAGCDEEGRAGTMTHDYERHGVTTLFAALDVLEGKVIGPVHEAPSHQEFIRFLKSLRREYQEKNDPHHRRQTMHPQASRRHAVARKTSAFVFPLHPTSASWLNAIEGFFAKLTKKRLKRGVFRSLRELKDAHPPLPRRHHANPKPYLDQGPKENHRGRQTRAPSVRFDPLASWLAGLSEILNGMPNRATVPVTPSLQLPATIDRYSRLLMSFGGFSKGGEVYKKLYVRSVL